MRDPMVAPGPAIEWAVAARPIRGEPRSGDLHLVKPFPGGLLVAVVDGLGHGPEAAEAARLAIAALAAGAGEPVVALAVRCHQAVRETRGVALTLATIDGAEGTLTWLGIGNVEGLLVRGDPMVRPDHEYVVLRGGVVGDHLPTLRASSLRLGAGDVLIMATDGIGHGLTLGLDMGAPAQRIADEILSGHGKGTDDALVLVVRYMGTEP